MLAEVHEHTLRHNRTLQKERDMRALVKTAPGVGHLEILDVEMPEAGAGEALMRVGPSGLCGTDLLL